MQARTSHKAKRDPSSVPIVRTPVLSLIVSVSTNFWK
jgi:hypothetical protein